MLLQLMNARVRNPKKSDSKFFWGKYLGLSRTRPIELLLNWLKTNGDI